MARMKVSEEDLDLLTEEERIGLKEHMAELDAEAEAEDAEIAAAATSEPDKKPDKKPAKAAKAEEDQEEEAETETDAEAEAEAEEEGEEEGEAEAEEGEAEAEGEDGPEEGQEEGAEGEEEGDEAEEEEPAVAATPAYVAPKLSKAEEDRFVAIKKQLKDIAQKFDDGELTAVELREQEEVLIDERDALKEKRTLARAAADQAVHTWFNATIPIFFSKHTEYKEGTLRHKMLDTLVRTMQAESENPTDPQILVKAHEQIVGEFGEANGAEKKPAAKKNGKARREMPPSLKDVPAAEANQIVKPDKFARLEKLKGADYEKALARLSPADRDLYLQGG